MPNSHTVRRMNANRPTYRDPLLVLKQVEPTRASVEPAVAVEVARAVYEYLADKIDPFAGPYVLLNQLTDYIDNLESGEEVVTFVPPTQ